MKNYEHRIQTIRDYAVSKHEEGVLIFGSHEYPGYIQYLTGIRTKSSATYLWITQNKTVFLEIGYMAADLKRQSSYEVIEFEDENTIPSEMKQILESYKEICLIGLAPYIHLHESETKIRDITPYADTLLMKKSPDEIASIKKIASNLHDIFTFVGNTIRVGMTEKELAQFIQQEALKRAEKYSFPLNIVSGERIVHATIGEPTDYAFRKGDCIAIDMGLYDGYYSDATRMFFLDNPKAEERYKKLCSINTDVARSIRPGKTTIGDVKNTYISLLKKNEMPYETLEIPYLGHSIGFFLHEQPFLYQEQYEQTIIPQDMIFTLEPEIAYPEYHLRIEDMYVSQKKTVTKIT